MAYLPLVFSFLMICCFKKSADVQTFRVATVSAPVAAALVVVTLAGNGVNLHSPYFNTIYNKL